MSNSIGFGGCVAVGACFALALHSALGPLVVPRSAPKVGISVSTRVAPAEPTQAETIVTKDVLFLPAHTTSESKSVSPSPLGEDAPVEQLTSSPLPTLAQPEAPTTSVGSVQGLPPIAQSEKTSDPFEGVTFSDKPGGDILVLGIKIDEHGAVLDSQILIPSSYRLGDMAIALASVKLRWTDVVPPLLPGETRWITQRIDQRRVNQITTDLP